MSSIKILGLAAVATALSAPALADPIQFASVSSDPTSWSGATNGSSGVFNINGGTTVAGVGADAFQTSFSVLDDSGNVMATVPNVYVQFNGGNGVTTGGLTHSGSTYSFTTTEALTISYLFASPQSVLGYSGITDLLTVTFAAGTTFTDNAGISSFTTDQPTGVFASELFRFTNSTEQSAAFIASTAHVNVSGGITTLTSNESGNFSADPYPAIPEAPSALLLIAGMTVVAVGARRRAF